LGRVFDNHHKAALLLHMAAPEAFEAPRDLAMQLGFGKNRGIGGLPALDMQRRNSCQIGWLGVFDEVWGYEEVFRFCPVNLSRIRKKFKTWGPALSRRACALSPVPGLKP